MQSHERRGEGKPYEHVRRIDSLTHRVGRWVINLIAASIVPIVIMGWRDRAEHITIQQSTIHRLDITNIRIDNLQKEVQNQDSDARVVREEIMRQLEDLKAETADINRYLRKKL